MLSETIKLRLSERFAASLPEFYKRRIVFRHDEDGEFSDDVDELDISPVQKHTGYIHTESRPLEELAAHILMTALSRTMPISALCGLERFVSDSNKAYCYQLSTNGSAATATAIWRTSAAMWSVNCGRLTASTTLKSASC